MAPSENIKDLLVLYEEEAEEWAVYFRDVLLHIVKMEAMLLYSLANSSARHLEQLGLNSYKCKLLILSNSLLKGLTPRKCRFLDTLLHSPESVVILLCGVKSSDELYELLTISPGSLEISTEQEPEDYISVIRSVIQRGSQNYFEVNNPQEIGMELYIETNTTEETEAALETPESSLSSVLVLPAKISCEDPGDIFILLKDEIIGDNIEIEFATDNKCIRTQPPLWSKTVRCMKAFDFPAGSVNVNVYCDGNIKATTKIKYYTIEKEVEHALKETDPGHGARQGSLEELDTILTSIFKAEIPHYDLRKLQKEMHHQENKQFRELPTLLHCAAKFGLKNLAVHLLQCSGAAWASKARNIKGADPAHIAESQGHGELKRIFEEFSIHEDNRNDDLESEYVETMEDAIPSASPFCSTMIQHTSHHQGRGQIYKEEAEAEQKEEEEEQDDEDSRQESGNGVESEDELYVVIPGNDQEGNSQNPLFSDRPPLPPPRAVVSPIGPEKPHCLLPGKILEGQCERSQAWCDLGAKKETEDELKREKEMKEENEEEEEEDPYASAETEENEYDIILANGSIKKKIGGRSFIINRPPAPAPRPSSVPIREETTPYIAQVFQQKTTRPQQDGDKVQAPVKKPDRTRVDNQHCSALKCCIPSGQEELILLQEKVKTGELSVDEALKKFKQWQTGKSGLEIIQQEKLRQLRDCIIGKRPEEENFYDKITIVHHPDFKETAPNENIFYGTPATNKLCPRPQVDKEYSFCWRKDH
ncbi:B-cell scaffold protein with ankyrin repeats isoform X2 [Dromiciops gliroides]|uniref:B-cell scaffold protein with ankyrin repeats isoform X2 n=1 Tax=Dromiciops gliroides TaxID=33562 RepID=UPI001CC5D2DE|nr:B-cell scaffold protein with ankyrin repeats isoform X2 [Dromiciops gliroides]